MFVLGRSLKIRDIDLAPEDFSFEQLVRANKRLRMGCYYKVETKAQATNRLRKVYGVNQRVKEDTTSPEEQKQIKNEERARLFQCFRKFFLQHQTRLFTLQKLDEMLVGETASCEDRLVNPKCVTKQAHYDAPDPLVLSGGGGGGGGAVSGPGGIGGGAGGGEGLSGGTGDSLTKDADDLQVGDQQPAEGTQDGKAFTKEQDGVQESRQSCCKNTSTHKAHFMNKCLDGTKSVPREMCKGGESDDGKQSAGE